MKILVTGGTGFLGARLIPDLLNDGHEVFGLARSPSAGDKLRRLGATPVQGDLEAGGPIVLPPMDSVLHVAAHFRFAGRRAPYFRTNVDGTAALIRGAGAAGASSFIYLSAAALVMDDRGSPVRNADESAPTFPDSFSAYIASKAHAETLVLAANRPGFRTLALRPPLIWGPGDRVSRAIPEAIEAGRFAFVRGGDYPYSTCHADNVVEALRCALERGAGGRSYFVSDPGPTTFRAFVAMLAGRHGLSVDGIRSAPYGVLFGLARLMEIAAAVLRSEDDPPLSRTLVRMIGQEFTIDDSAARRELGYVGRLSAAEGLATYAG